MEMTKETYNSKLQKIEADFEAAKKTLYIEYAMSNAKYKKGDIIKSSATTILIDKLSTYKGLYEPEVVYHGVILKKDLTPTKKGERSAIYGTHNIELIKSA